MKVATTSATEATSIGSAVVLFGLLPSIAVTTSLVKGFCIGVIIALVFIGTSVICSLLRTRIAESWRIPFLLTISTLLTTLLQMNLAAFIFATYAALGMFVPLVAANSLIFTRGLTLAFRQPIWPTLCDALALSVTLIFVLSVLGAIREFAAYGTLFAGAETLFGPHAKEWLWHPLPKNYSFILAAMAPGALIILGILYALKNLIQRGSPADSPADLR
jgi:Na+-translocating ferredoxin:NAD+ oxidoreductase subunit E